MSLIEPNHTNRNTDVSYGSQMSAIPLKKGERTITTTVRLPESDYGLIRARAEEAGIKFSDYVRNALLEYEALTYLVSRRDISENIASIMDEAMRGEQEGGQ